MFVLLEHALEKCERVKQSCVQGHGFKENRSVLAICQDKDTDPLKKKDYQDKTKDMLDNSNVMFSIKFIHFYVHQFTKPLESKN